MMRTFVLVLLLCSQSLNALPVGSGEGPIEGDDLDDLVNLGNQEANDANGLLDMEDRPEEGSVFEPDSGGRLPPIVDEDLIRDQVPFRPVADRNGPLPWWYYPMDRPFTAERLFSIRNQIDSNRRLEELFAAIMGKALNQAARFNGTTTKNVTEVVEDENGNSFKVQTVVKKGNKNQTMLIETIESIPPLSKKTKRSNWLAEPYQ